MRRELIDHRPSCAMPRFAGLLPAGRLGRSGATRQYSLTGAISRARREERRAPGRLLHTSRFGRTHVAEGAIGIRPDREPSGTGRFDGPATSADPLVGGDLLGAMQQDPEALPSRLRTSNPLAGVGVWPGRLAFSNQEQL